MHLSPSRVIVYFGPSDSSFVPLYLRNETSGVPAQRRERDRPFDIGLGCANHFGFQANGFSFVAFGILQFLQELRWRGGVGIFDLDESDAC